MHKLSTIKDYAASYMTGTHPHTLREAIETAVEVLDNEAAEYAAKVEADEYAEMAMNERRSNYELY